MLLDALDYVTITNDDALILKDMDFQHTSVKVMVGFAETHDDDVGE